MCDIQTQKYDNGINCLKSESRVTRKKKEENSTPSKIVENESLRVEIGMRTGKRKSQKYTFNRVCLDHIYISRGK